VRHIARWDLDKTYLRTEFDTLKQLVRTALERPDEKRTNPGAATVMRELARAGSTVHILSGSPEQMRSRIEAKLAIDGVRYESLVLKPNLQNLVRLRFRAVRDQLGYKLSALLAARGVEQNKTGPLPVETLFGDDAEVDGFVYSVYAAIVSRAIDLDVVVAICQSGGVYEDTRDAILASARNLLRAPAVERILIHLESRTPPSEFEEFGSRLVPFFNYAQAAFVLLADGRLDADGALRVCAELVVDHHFDGDSLAKSHAELARRGALPAAIGPRLAGAVDSLAVRGGAREELLRMVDVIVTAECVASPCGDDRACTVDWVARAKRKHKKK
jgi:hypothetical protein